MLARRFLIVACLAGIGMWSSGAARASETDQGILDMGKKGVVCDGRSDNTQILQETFAHELREKLIVFPPGSCLFKRPLHLKLNRVGFRGVGGAATILLYGGDDVLSDLVTVENSYGVNFEHFGIWSKIRRTAGAALHIIRSSYITFSDLHVNKFETHDQSLWDGIWIDQPNFVTINDVYLQAHNDALAVSAHGVGTDYQYDVFVTNSKLSDSGVGLHVAGGIDNVHVDTTEITSNDINVLDDNSRYQSVNQEIYIGSGAVLDQALETNIVINDNACNRKNYGIVNIAGVVTHAMHGDGVEVRAFPDCELVVTSPLIAKNQRDGVSIADQRTHVIIAPSVVFSDNGRYAIFVPRSSNTFHLDGVFIENGGGNIKTGLN